MENTVTPNKLPFIIAVDFDGTLCEDKWPDIGTENRKLIGQCTAWRKLGYKVILWTCRNDDHLDNAVEFCRSFGLEFDAVNDNIPEVKERFGGNARKIYANVYIDDKAKTPEIPLYWIPKEFEPWRLNPV